MSACLNKIGYFSLDTLKSHELSLFHPISIVKVFKLSPMNLEKKNDQKDFFNSMYFYVYSYYNSL